MRTLTSLNQALRRRQGLVEVMVSAVGVKGKGYNVRKCKQRPNSENEGPASENQDMHLKSQVFPTSPKHMLEKVMKPIINETKLD